MVSAPLWIGRARGTAPAPRPRRAKPSRTVLRVLGAHGETLRSVTLDAGISRRTPLPTVDPLDAALAAAASSDEPITDEERAAADEGLVEYLAGETLSFAEVFGPSAGVGPSAAQ